MEEFRSLETPEMRRRLDRGGAAPWSLYLLLGLNLLAWTAMMLAPGNAAGFWGDPDLLHAYRWGALNDHAVFANGEYWRLLSAPFTHLGWAHLTLNLFFLWVFGHYAIRWYGNTQFLLLYLLTGLAGAVASLHFAAQGGLSAGASGAVFGVLAAMSCSVYQHRELLTSGHFIKLTGSYGLYLVIGVGSGFMESGIDNAAHLGGALAGAHLGWFLIERFEHGEQRSLSHSRHALAVVPLLGILLLAVIAVPAPSRDLGAQLSEYVPLQPLYREALAINAAIEECRQDRDNAPQTLPSRIEAELLPRLGALQHGLAALDERPPTEWNRIRTGLHDYARHQAFSHQNIQQLLQTSDPGVRAQLLEAITRAEADAAEAADALKALGWPLF